MNAIVNYTFGLERIIQERNGVKHFYFSDGQGSIRCLTDASGTVTDTYDYFAFGELLKSTGTTENEFRYVGEAFDGNSGYYYLKARWMDVSSGRFVSVDPFAGDPNAPISLHRYLYANGSPVSMSDPSGEYTLTEVMTTVAISTAIASYAIPNFKGFLWKASGGTDNFGLQFVLGGYGGHILAGGMMGAYIWEEPATDGTYFGRKRAYFNVWMIGLGEGIVANIVSSEIHIRRPYNRKTRLANFAGLGRITTAGYDVGIGAGSLGVALQLPEGTYIDPVPGFSLEIGKGAGGIIALVYWQLRFVETLRL